MKNLWIIVGVIILLAFLVIFIIFLLRNISILSLPSQEPVASPITLESYSLSNATVTFTDTGSIKSNDLYRSVRITISKDIKRVEILAGYNYTPIKSSVYENTPEAYRAFLASIQVAGFGKEKRNVKVTSPEGQCPLGHNRYFFSATDIPEMPQNLWSSNCSVAMGTFDGNFSTIQSLFKAQIPDYNKFTANVNF